jgi:hypothetical protein
VVRSKDALSGEMPVSLFDHKTESTEKSRSGLLQALKKGSSLVRQPSADTMFLAVIAWLNAKLPAETA